MKIKILLLSFVACLLTACWGGSSTKYYHYRVEPEKFALNEASTLPYRCYQFVEKIDETAYDNLPSYHKTYRTNHLVEEKFYPGINGVKTNSCVKIYSNNYGVIHRQLDDHVHAVTVDYYSGYGIEPSSMEDLLLVVAALIGKETNYSFGSFDKENTEINRSGGEVVGSTTRLQGGAAQISGSGVTNLYTSSLFASSKTNTTYQRSAQTITATGKHIITYYRRKPDHLSAGEYFNVDLLIKSFPNGWGIPSTERLTW